MDYEAVTEDEDDALSAWAQSGDGDIEGTLRPRKLDEFIGQPRVREQLELVLESARRRGVPPDHVLFSGPPGLGKTSMAMIVAAELGAAIRVSPPGSASLNIRKRPPALSTNVTVPAGRRTSATRTDSSNVP